MSITHNAIKTLNFFNTLTDTQVEFLSNHATLESYNKDYLLCYEQSITNKLLFLVAGEAKAFKIDKHENEIFLFYIQHNNLISDISDIYDNNHLFFSNISFTEDSKVLSIDYKIFKEHFLQTNILTMNFANEIILKSSKLESLINREFIFDAVTKVAMMIDSDLVMFNKLKRHDMALLLHIQPATLSRVLNRLRKNNLIDIVHGKVSILDKKNLEIIYKDYKNE